MIEDGLAVQLPCTTLKRPEFDDLSYAEKLVIIDYFSSGTWLRGRWQHHAIHKYKRRIARIFER